MGSKQPEEKRKGRFYNVFSSPDGQDCLKKVCYGTAYGFATGSVVSVYDIIGYTGATSVSGGLARWTFHAFPMAAVGGVYTGVACISGNMRGKDDQWNHIIAGFAAGGVYGIKFQSQKVGWGAGMIFAAAGCFVKTLKQLNVKVIPDHIKNQTGFYDYRKAYLTTRPDPEGKPEY